MIPCPILPGKTIGIIGGGQLGRMLCIAARRMGYRIWVLDPDPECPAEPVADRLIAAEYNDPASLAWLAEHCAVVTYEFENVPAGPLECFGPRALPAPGVLHTCQNREREKLFLRKNGIPCAEFRVCGSFEEFAAALVEIGTPSVLKTVDFGYDGKGQMKIPAAPERSAESLWQEWGGARAVLEAWVPFEAELSVLVARNAAGEISTFPPSENIHTRHILDWSIVPARFPEAVLEDAGKLATQVAEAFSLTGLIAVEMFLTREGKLLVNEMAPRPHNSGHYSFDACVTSQFEQQIRAVCGLPLGSTRLLSPVVMVNLLGDLWTNGAPDWSALLREPEARLHLYGKIGAKPGRKMGHFCVLDPDLDVAMQKAEKLQSALRGE